MRRDDHEADVLVARDKHGEALPEVFLDSPRRVALIEVRNDLRLAFREDDDLGIAGGEDALGKSIGARARRQRRFMEAQGGTERHTRH